MPAATGALTLLLASLAIASCAVIAEQSFVRWRLVGDAVAARLCVAFTVYGTVVVPLAATPVDGVGGALGQLIGTIGATAALVSILRCPDVVSRSRLGVPAAAVGVCAAAAAVLVGAHPGVASALTVWTVAGQSWLEVAGALTVVVGAGVAAASGLRLKRRSLTCTASALTFLVVAPAVASTGPTPPAAHLLTAAVQAGALALILPVTIADSRLALRAVGRANSSLRERWRDAVESLDGLTREQAERSHELRSALLALEGASEVLRRHVAHRGEPDDAALAAALGSELARLRSLVAQLPLATHQGFGVRAALLPVVLAHRACGQLIDLDVSADVQAAGRPQALAEAVGNLLTNAADHAPGSRVTIGAHVDATVRVIVTDDGPGLDPAILTDPPHTSDGARPLRGLGLPVAARLIRADGGDLTILRPQGSAGAAIMIDLPRATRLTDGRGELWSATAS
ncbi:sensor histidine kinase [Actinotalea fermentans]|uniref:sensor histidine kinase n=1 Tax=Actinotalea fermentans TaxID=43671 RepID=UPI0011BF9F80|nr:HAMP domain-containing sensor histidine kinase [Actinotalea fermentans]